MCILHCLCVRVRVLACVNVSLCASLCLSCICKCICLYICEPKHLTLFAPQDPGYVGDHGDSPAGVQTGALPLRRRQVPRLPARAVGGHGGRHQEGRRRGSGRPGQPGARRLDAEREEGPTAVVPRFRRNDSVLGSDAADEGSAVRGRKTCRLKWPLFIKDLHLAWHFFFIEKVHLKRYI